MNLYFEIPAHLTKYMSNSDDIKFDLDLSPAELATAKWLMADSEYRNSRLKLIPLVAEGPWAVRNLVTGRPALIGKKLPVSYELFPQNTVTGDAPLLIATLDIGNSSTTAKRIVSICRRYMSALTLDVGFVIQSETQEELPEQMLGAVRVHGPDPLLAPQINAK
jgi:Protein ENHANCED DISEASE RESISTANCE 2, C-terminal